MRTLLLIALLITSAHASAGQRAKEDKFILNGQEVSQVEAIQALMKDKNAEVFKCSEQELRESRSSIGLKNKPK